MTEKSSETPAREAGTCGQPIEAHMDAILAVLPHVGIGPRLRCKDFYRALVEAAEFLRLANGIEGPYVSVIAGPAFVMAKAEAEADLTGHTSPSDLTKKH